jgi:hypothetical protein
MTQGSHLLAAGINDTVRALSHALNAKLGFHRCPAPSVPLTNGIVLDLYRCSKEDRDSTVSLPQRLVELLYHLGYIQSVDREAQKKWNTAGSRMHKAFCVRNSRKLGGLAKDAYLAQIRDVPVPPFDTLVTPTAVCCCMCHVCVCAAAVNLMNMSYMNLMLTSLPAGESGESDVDLVDLHSI